MANNLSSNTSTFVKRFAQVAVPGFESSRVVSKTVDTQWIDGDNGITPQTGATVYMKRSPLFKAVRTVGGDLTSSTANDLAIGRIPATVQNFISVHFEYSGLEEVTQLDELERIVKPAFSEIATDLELMVAQFALENAGLTYGSPGTVVDAWADVAGADSLLTSIGCPESGERNYVLNPFGKQNLANAVTQLDNPGMVKDAWEKSLINRLGNLDVRTSNALKTYQAGAASDRAGTLAATPNATFNTHKDSMVQTLSLTGLSASTTDAVRAGDVIEFTDRYLINVKNKQMVFGADGNPVKYRMTVVSGGNSGASGELTVTAVNAAIYGAAGGQDQQYTTISSPLTSGDAFTILGTANTTYQPNLFYHKSAIALGSVKLPRLAATDFYLRSEDGLVIRVTRGSELLANKQIWRLDMLPVLGCTNQMFIGKGFGV